MWGIQKHAHTDVGSIDNCQQLGKSNTAVNNALLKDNSVISADEVEPISCSILYFDFPSCAMNVTCDL